jgi:hypothetical protein
MCERPDSRIVLNSGGRAAGHTGLAAPPAPMPAPPLHHYRYVDTEGNFAPLFKFKLLLNNRQPKGS